MPLPARRWRIVVLCSAVLVLADSNGLLAGETATSGERQAFINMMGLLFCGFLIFFMQAGFAMVETGLTRAKNVVHTMAMNVMAYSVGALGYWICGFALMFGNYGDLSQLGPSSPLGREFSINLGGHEFGLFGYDGFFLAGRSLEAGLLAWFFFQMMFMDTAATIPTGALTERWRFLSFLIFTLFVSMILYPVYGNWVWGNGWLARLGANFGLGHGHVDFAGASVVHMVGGGAALAGVLSLGPRLGKYRPDGKPNPMPAHNVPMYLAGTLVLAFGWFGFNTGSCLGAGELNSARVAVNTLLSPAAAACTSLAYLWLVFRKPDPSFICNGMLAGLVAITGPCAFVAPWAAVLIGGVAGVLVVVACLYLERSLRLDDPVGAIGVHGVCGIWGILAVGLFADGSFGQGLNQSFLYRLGDGQLQWSAHRLTDQELQALPRAVELGVTGLFYGNPAQLGAECIGIVANLLWVVPLTLAFFRVLDRLVGNRVPAQVEVQGLDVPELGALGYILQDPKAPENRLLVAAPAEPRAARVPPALAKRFRLAVEGIDQDLLASTWSDFSRDPDEATPPEVKAIYRYMTTLQGNRFTFRGGDAETLRETMERLLRSRLPGKTIRVLIET